MATTHALRPTRSSSATGVSFVSQSCECFVMATPRRAGLALELDARVFCNTASVIHSTSHHTSVLCSVVTNHLGARTPVYNGAAAASRFLETRGFAMTRMYYSVDMFQTRLERKLWTSGRRSRVVLLEHLVELALPLVGQAVAQALHLLFAELDLVQQLALLHDQRRLHFDVVFVVGELRRQRAACWLFNCKVISSLLWQTASVKIWAATTRCRLLKSSVLAKCLMPLSVPLVGEENCFKMPSHYDYNTDWTIYVQCTKKMTAFTWAWLRYPAKVSETAFCLLSMFSLRSFASSCCSISLFFFSRSNSCEKKKQHKRCWENGLGQ